MRFAAEGLTEKFSSHRWQVKETRVYWPLREPFGLGIYELYSKVGTFHMADFVPGLVESIPKLRDVYGGEA